jgi:membrane protease YdiL (CAAX protease family)
MKEGFVMKSISKNKLPVIQLIIAVISAFIAVFGLSMFNQYLLMSFSLPIRMVLMIVTQWLMLIGPGVLMFVNKEKLTDIGFRKDKILVQIGIGIILAIAMSLVLTVVPILLGFKDMVGSIKYTETWKFVYQFIYAITGVALAEEIVFRGYSFSKLLEIKNQRWFAIIVSSLLFGLFHIFNGNIVQVIMTSFLGVLFCLFREKIKGCTLLSLIIAHGSYNAMIVLWVSVL